MDLYPSIETLILQQPALGSWEQARALLAKAVRSRPSLWRFPVVTCMAVGGTVDQALPGAAAIACAHIAIHLVDDLLDDDPSGAQHRLGVGGAANLASAFQGASLSVLCEGNARALNAHAVLNQALLCTAWGQARDVENTWGEADYWQIAEDRSAPLFAAAFEIGAWLGGASAAIAQKLYHLGGVYGVMIQISDDLGDALAAPAGPDWLQGRAALPLLYASTVHHPERERFLALRSQVAAPACLEEAQAILVRSGAVAYCLHQLLMRYQQALKELDELPLSTNKEIQKLFTDLVYPIQNLIETASFPAQHSLSRHQPVQGIPIGQNN